MMTREDVQRVSEDDIRRMIKVCRVLRCFGSIEDQHCRKFTAQVANKLVREEHLPYATEAFIEMWERVKQIQEDEDE